MQERTSPLKFAHLAEKSGLNSVPDLSTKVQTEGCRALANLAALHLGMPDASVAAVLAAMATYPRSTTLQLTACRALATKLLMNSSSSPNFDELMNLFIKN